jgi:hypothetical protein
MTAGNLRYCALQGSLIGMSHWLPTQPFDYSWGPMYGCNNIRCSSCGQTVIATPATESSRRYKCGCVEELVYNAKILGQVEGFPGSEAMMDPPPGSWACAGHPVLVAPFELDGVFVSPERFDEVARVGFAAPPFLPANTTGQVFWVSRLYWLLEEQLRPALGEAVANLVADSDPRVAVRAMRFFSALRNAPGSERLTAIAREHGARMATISDPDYPNYTVENTLLTALEYRGFLRDDKGQLVDPEALEVMRRAVLSGKNPNDVLFTFAEQDPVWFAAHAVDIVTASPKLIRQVVWLLKDQQTAFRDNKYRDIANVNPAMRSALLERIKAEFDGEERQRILTTIERHA